MKPRVFISSVSREPKTVRQLVAKTLTALGYAPVWQDIFGTHSETEHSVRRLRDDLTKMRRRFRGWMIGVSVALVLIAGEIACQLHGSSIQDEQRNGMGNTISQTNDYIVNPDRMPKRMPKRMRDQIARSTKETYELAGAKSKDIKNRRDRDEAVELAERQRDANLERVDELLESIVADIESGEASPESIEFARVLEEEGADEAIAFIAAKKEQILNAAQAIADNTEQGKLESRKSLALLLKSARLLANKGEYDAARQQCDEVLDFAPNWPEALHVQIQHLIALEDLAERYETSDHVRVLFWERKLLKLRQTMALADDSDSQKLRNLSISFENLGVAYLKLGRTKDGLKKYQDALEIRQTLARADTSDSQKQQDLSGIL